MTTPNKADPKWDIHKATIEPLYVQGNLRGLMDTMTRDYGFSKTKSQYESQFKIWGIRKYRRNDEWKSIGRHISERKRAGKESHVYINGKPIPISKVQKEIRRHGFMTVLEQNRPAPIPSIPDGFEIRTPAAEETVPLTALPGDTPSSPIETETRGCASSQLQIVSSSLTSQTVSSDASLAILGNALSPSPLIVPTDLSPIQGNNAITPTLCSPGVYESLDFVFEEVDESFRPLKLVQLLLRSGASSTMETLTCAVKSRNKKLIRFLIDNGAVADASDESATKIRYISVEAPEPAPSPLSEAIRWGDGEILRSLEENGAWSRIINKVTVYGEFEDVLIAASVRGKFTTVQKLLKYRPSNTYGNDLSDALVAAIYLNESAIVLTLLDAGANVNGGLYEFSDINAAVEKSVDSASYIDTGMKRSHRGPALLEALLQKNEHLVRLILDADVRLDEVDHRKREARPMTALRAAVEWGNIPIIKDLISMGIPMALEAVEVSIKKRDIECTQLLVRAGVDTSWALISAVTNNNIEMVEYLFSVGAHPDNSQALLEAEALSDGLPMIVRLLTEFARSYPHGKPGYGGDTFQQAILKGNFTLIKLLLDAKIDVNFAFSFEPSPAVLNEGDYSLSPGTKTILGEAITQRHTTSHAMSQMLLKEVGDPNIVVQNFASNFYHIRETALLVAIDTEDVQKVQLVIDAGANVNWPATKGVKRTPLQKAAEIGRFEITEVLIKEGGLVNNEPAVRGGATALQLAAIGGYIGIALLLLEKGADVNAPAAKFYGRTALEGAAEHGRIDMLKLLWNAGAKFQGNEYEKARELAKENGHMATWRYLETLHPSSEMNSMDN